MKTDDAYEVSDSSDWLETPLRSLSAVDAALRCQVCKDFYTTPMITSCSHTFCSLCIRRCLNNDGQCPTCRAKDQELKLRLNAVMEDLVEAFKKARPEIYTLATKPATSRASKSPKRGREGTDKAVEYEGPSRKRLRSTRQTRSTQELVIVDTDEEDRDFLPDGFVRCPICSKQVKEASINSHIDRNCPDESYNPKAKVSSIPSPSKGNKRQGKRPERLAQVHYSMVKDVGLRKKLSEQGLGTYGNRQAMERRYTEWVTLWNANCDATHPKGKGELRRELDIWERTQGAQAPFSSANHIGAQIKSKDFDAAAWSTLHNSSFKDLIANARKKAQASNSMLESRPKSPIPELPVSSKPHVVSPNHEEAQDLQALASFRDLSYMPPYASQTYQNEAILGNGNAFRNHPPVDDFQDARFAYGQYSDASIPEYSNHLPMFENKSDADSDNPTIPNVQS
ncbi:postreplication repair E3 ubiquitin-protein ligase rad18 [Amylocarpus encephaloides]|uniref:Postreplication repair E3 ubiquitin-protein ligase RAD18 n=1 Tax=Amylocarpus encephaloides TaxID=45428 RepID=A0A9P7YI24_9HELO|nr:postreplication repair E3 ubiquitin-protein ligase rad18 [Amylocarpus encephaloides]